MQQRAGLGCAELQAPSPEAVQQQRCDVGQRGSGGLSLALCMGQKLPYSFGRAQRLLWTWVDGLQVGRDPRPVMRAAYECFKSGSPPDAILQVGGWVGEWQGKG